MPLTESQTDPTDSATCLVLMFKAPNRSKRRLAAQIGAQAAAAAGRLFDCAREDAALWPGPVCFAPAEDEDAAWLSATIGDQPLVIPQQGPGLGERINHVNRRLREQSHPKQIFIGIDCPQLDPEYLRAADAHLATYDLVVGPAHDGGAVLIATRAILPDLAHLPWSTPELLNALTSLARSRQWSPYSMHPLADIDTLEDLQAATASLRDDSRAARRALCDWIARSGIGPLRAPG